MILSKLSDYFLDAFLQRVPTGTEVILCDVDGVLFDNRHRLHHIVESIDGKEVYLDEPNWPAFNAEVGGDKAMGMCKIIGRFANVYPVVFLTARRESPFQVTTFVRAIEPYMPVGGWCVHFRDADEFPHKVPSHVYKRTAVQRMREAGLVPVIAFDDSLDQVNMYRDLGIVAMRCHDVIDEHNLLY